MAVDARLGFILERKEICKLNVECENPIRRGPGSDLLKFFLDIRGTDANSVWFHSNDHTGFKLIPMEVDGTQTGYSLLPG